MEYTNRLIFIITVTSALLMHFMDTSQGFILKEIEDSPIELNTNLNRITENNREIYDELPVTAFEVQETTDSIQTTTMSSDIITTDSTVLVNKVIEDVKNITLRGGKSLDQNLTIDMPENNEATLKNQMIELNTISDTEAPEQITEENTKLNEKLIQNITTDQNIDSSLEQTEDKQTELPILNEKKEEKQSEPILNVREPGEHIEIQKITTGEDLEESIKKEIRDEIISETPIDQNTLDVIQNMPNSELRESTAREILGEDYVRRSELHANLNNGDENVKYETVVPDSPQATEIPALKDDQVTVQMQTIKDENTLSSVPEVNVESVDINHMVTDTPEIHSETTFASEQTEEKTDESLSPEMQSSSSNQVGREGRSMGMSNSIRNNGETEDLVKNEDNLLVNSKVVLDLENNEITTERSNEMPTQNSDIDSLDKPTENPNSETVQINESTVEEQNGVIISGEDDEPIVQGRNAVSNEDNEILVGDSLDLKEKEKTDHAPIDANEILSSTVHPIENVDNETNGKDEVQHELNVMKNQESNSNDIEESINTEKQLETVTEAVQFENFEKDHDEEVTPAKEENSINEAENVENPHTESISESETTVNPIQMVPISDVSDILPENKVVAKENNLNVKDSSSSESNSSEEQQSDKNKTKKSEKKTKYDSSSEESDSESSEKLIMDNTKSSSKPKPRSFSVVSVPELINESDILTPIPEVSENSEHMTIKKPSAESEDENSLTSGSINIKTTTVPIILNPHHKILLPSDETEKMPKLTFETTTLLPLKTFKSHPSEPVLTDDIPNETNFAGRLLNDLPEKTEQIDQNIIDELLKTESTIRLITGTITEGVELSKDINRNTNLFRDSYETNRPISTLDTENIPATNNEIMAEPSIAEALPNQHLKSANSSMNTTLVVLICVSIMVMIIAVIVVTFFRFRTPQGVLDIEMQEQRLGKDIDCSDEHHLQNDYQCCTTIRTSSVSSHSTSNIDDTLSNSATGSLLTTSSSSSSSGQSKSSALIKRSASDCKSNSSIHENIGLLSTELFDEKEKCLLQTSSNADEQTKLEPTETCKLIPKIQLNINNTNFNDEYNNADDDFKL